MMQQILNAHFIISLLNRKIIFDEKFYFYSIILFSIPIQVIAIVDESINFIKCL